MTDTTKKLSGSYPPIGNPSRYLDENGVLREPSLDPIPDSVYEAIAEEVPQDYRQDEIVATLIPED